MYSVRNLEKTIRFSQKSRPSERSYWPEMSQIKSGLSKQKIHKNDQEIMI